MLHEVPLVTLCEMVWLSTGGLLEAALAAAPGDALATYVDTLIDVRWAVSFNACRALHLH